MFRDTFSFIFKRKKNGNLNKFERKEKIYEEAMERLEGELDVVEIIQKFQRLEFLINVVLENHQQILMDNYALNKVLDVSDEGVDNEVSTKQLSIINTKFQQNIMGIINHKMTKHKAIKSIRKVLK